MCYLNFYCNHIISVFALKADGTGGGSPLEDQGKGHSIWFGPSCVHCCIKFR